MRKFAVAALGAAAICIASSPALSEPYVEYTPQNGYWDINAIEVDPNHIDDYLVGLRQSQVSAFEVLKARGLIDSYKFMVRNGYVKGSPNVLIMTHSRSIGTLEADKARDQAVTKEIDAAFSRDRSKAAVAGYEKYRTFIDDGQWVENVMNK
jgi:hypothetical protein